MKTKILLCAFKLPLGDWGLKRLFDGKLEACSFKTKKSAISWALAFEKRNPKHLYTYEIKEGSK